MRPSIHGYTAAECLRKLEEFQAAMVYGKDLFTSIQSLMMYSFANYGLSDMFRFACSNPCNLEKCTEISTRICNSLLSTLKHLLVTRPTNEKYKIVEHIKLFRDVYELKTVPNLLDAEVLLSIDEMLDQIVNYIKRCGKDDNSCSLSPTESLRCFIEEQMSSLSYGAAKNSVFSKICSFEHNRSSKVIEAESKLSSNFVAGIEKVLEDAVAGNVNVSSMKELSNFHVGKIILLSDAIKITSKFLLVMDNFSIWSRDTVKICLAMLENFFHALTEEAKCLVMQRFYEKYLLTHENFLFLGIYLDTFSSEITKYVNEIGDHNEIQNNPEKFHRVFRFCRVLFVSPLKSAKETQECVPILIDSIIRIFEEEAQRLANTERQNNFIYLLCSLCRRKPGALLGKHALTAEESILEVNVLLRLFIIPNLMRRVHEVVILKLLYRLFKQVDVSHTRFKWSKAICAGESGVQAPEFLLLIVELLNEYEFKNEEATSICQSLLKSLGRMLKSDDIVFDAGTTEFILFFLRSYPWWMRYSICSWFSHTLSTPIQQIPSGLYKSLAFGHQEHCEEISVDFPFSHVYCFFRSLFELALFDVDLALDFLNKGIAVPPEDENLIEKIAIILVDSCEHSPYCQNITALAPLLSKLLKMLDPSQQVHFIESLSETTYHGLRLIQHILLVATSVKLAYHKRRTTIPVREISQPCVPSTYSSRVADNLLQTYCELTKTHVDKEVINFRRSVLPYPPEIKEDFLPPPNITIRRHERVYVQLAILFNITCSFTKLLPQPTSSLIVLINCLAEYIVEFQNLEVTSSLDKIFSDHYKANTVYAFAQTDVSKQLKDNQIKDGRKGTRGGGTSAPWRTNVDNTMNTFATVRQIDRNDIRRLVENRLISRRSSRTNEKTKLDMNIGHNGSERRITSHR